MPQRVKTLIKALLSLALAGIFLWAAFHRVALDRLWAAMQQAAPFWLAACVLLFLLAVPPRAWRWRILLRPIKPHVSFWHAASAIFIAYAGNNVFPRAGEIARGVALRRDEDIPLSAVLATVLVERVIDMLTLLLLFGGVLFALRAEIARIFPWIEGIAIAAFAVTLLLLLCFGVLSAYGDRALALLKRIVGRLSDALADRLVDILGAVFQGLGAVRTASGYLGILAFSLVLNGIYLLTTYAIFLSFPFASDHHLGLKAALVVMVISTVGIIIPTPGGTGTYHYFCSQALHHLYGVPLAEALALATVLHGLAFFTYLIAGSPGLLKLLFRHELGASAVADP